MKKVLSIIFGLLVLVVAGVLIAPQFINWNNYKPEIIKTIKDQAGYDVTIAGNLHLSVLPVPELQISGVSVKAPEGSTDEILVAIDRVDVQLDLMPLLAREVSISKVQIVKPVAQLEIFKDGSQNWMTDKLAPKENTVDKTSNSNKPSPIKNISISALTIKEGLFSYRDQTTDAFYSVTVNSATLKADTLKGPFDVNADIIYDEKDVIIDAKIGDISAKEGIQVNADIKTLNQQANTTFAGIFELGDKPDIQGNLSLNLKSIQKIASALQGTKTANGNLPDEGLEFTSFISSSSENISFEDAQMSLGGSEASVSLDVKGFGKKEATPEITLNAYFKDPIVLDKFIPISKTSSNNGKPSAEEASPTLPESFLPKTLSLPKNINLSAEIKADKVVLKDKTLSGVGIAAKLNKNGVLKSRVVVESLPGQGVLETDIALASFKDGPVLDITTNLKAQNSIETISAFKKLEKDQLEKLQSLKALNASADISIGSSQLTAKSVKLSSGPLAFTTTGKITAGQQGNYDLKTKLEVSDLNKINEGLKLNLPKELLSAVNKGDVLAALKGDLKSLEYTANLNALNGVAKASGRVSDFLQKPNVEPVSVQIEHSNISKVISAFVPDFKAPKGLQESMNFYAKVTQADKNIKVENIALKSNSLNLKGDLDVNLGAKKPDISGKFQVGTLNANNFLSPKPTGSKQKTPSSTTSGEKWSTEPINLAWMHALNMDLGLNVQNLIFDKWELKNLASIATLKDGAFIIDNAQADLFNGKLATNLSAIAGKNSGDPLKFSSDISLQNAFLQPLAAAFAGGSNRGVSGAGSLSTKITTTGVSIKDLISALDGDGLLEAKDITVKGFDLEKLSSNIKNASGWQGVASAIFQGPLSGGSTKFDLFNLPFTVEKGVMSFDQASLKNPIANATAKGKVSLPAYRVDVTSTLNLTQPEGVPPFSMTLAGPLNNPTQNFQTDALKSFTGNFVNDLIDRSGTAKKYEGLLRGVLGTPAPQQQPSNDNASSGEETQPAQQQQQPEPSPEEQIFRGILDQFGR